ncbi:hypothetical protein M5689_000469 [Euphorbia peplus]|nr:hypothetical protein M5689_000469 [Euphorbia peplus]
MQPWSSVRPPPLLPGVRPPPAGDAPRLHLPPAFSNHLVFCSPSFTDPPGIAPSGNSIVAVHRSLCSPYKLFPFIAIFL